MSGRECAFFKIGHPKQILVIAQAAASVFKIWFLHINAIAELRMTRRLIAHSHLYVFPLMTGDAFCSKLLSKLSCQRRVTCEVTRLEHGRLCQHIAICLCDGFFNRAGGMANFEADIPEQIKNLLHHLLDVG